MSLTLFNSVLQLEFACFISCNPQATLQSQARHSPLVPHALPCYLLWLWEADLCGPQQHKVWLLVHFYQQKLRGQEEREVTECDCHLPFPARSRRGHSYTPLQR